MFPLAAITPARTSVQITTNMSDNDDTSSRETPPDINPILTSDDLPPLEDEWAAAVKSVEARHVAPPTWSEIKKRHWNDIESKYHQGDRTKGIVCAWMAYKAALVVCKGWPRDSFDELLNEGYQAAIQRWEAAFADYVITGPQAGKKARKKAKKANALRYDPAKDAGNGMSGLVYTAALGRMRNAALELFTPSGKRKHRVTDVIPMVSVVSNVEHSMAKPLSAVTIPRDSERNYGVHYPLTGGGWEESPATFKKIPKGKKCWWWQSWGRDYDRNANRLARIAAEIHVNRLLAPLPKEDRDIITKYWGLDGIETATLDDLAERNRCSVATMRRKLNKLYIELKTIETQSKGSPPITGSGSP